MAQKITDPMVKALLVAADIDQADRDALVESNKTLVAALRGVYLSLCEHLAQESYEADVSVDELCPCNSGVLTVAHELLEKIDDNSFKIERG